MEEKTKQDLKLTGEIILWLLSVSTIIGMLIGIAYLITNFHWAFGFLILPIIIGIIYLLIKVLGVNEIEEC